MDPSRRQALQHIGWNETFEGQLAAYEAHLQAARVVAVQRFGLTIAPAVGATAEVAIGGRFYVQAIEARPTVGDWVLVNPKTGALEARLTRSSLIKRLNPLGEVQLIAANIDTAFIVTSCNDDFSLARLERYLSVILEADIQPVVVLTKIDLAPAPEVYVEQAQGLGALVPVMAVNALDASSLAPLSRWCETGQSIALLGSSGVGKSTLVNTLSGEQVQITQAIRVEDGKGRHTTTHRSLHRLPQGGVILDSPGMRELQLADAEQGVESVFADIEAYAASCRFNDCIHASEPGCAVQAAIAAGQLDARRLERYFKLQREEQVNRENTAQRHARMRQTHKQRKRLQRDKDKG